MQCSYVRLKPVIQNSVEQLKKHILNSAATADITIELSGRYEFRVCEEVLKNMEGLNVINVEWISDRKREKRNHPHYKLHTDSVSEFFRKLTTNSFGMNEHVGKMVVGYTKSVMISSSNEHTIFYAHPCFQN